MVDRIPHLGLLRPTAAARGRPGPRARPGLPQPPRSGRRRGGVGRDRRDARGPLPRRDGRPHPRPRFLGPLMGEAPRRDVRRRPRAHAHARGRLARVEALQGREALPSLGREGRRGGARGGRLHRRRDRDGPRRPLPHKGGQWRRQKQTRDGTLDRRGDRPQRPRDPNVRHRPRPEVRDSRMDRAARQEGRDGGRRHPARRARQVGEVQSPRPRHSGTRDRGRRRCRGRAPRAIGGHRARRLLLRPEVLHGRQPQPADRPLPARDYGRSDPRRRAEPLNRARAPGAPRRKECREIAGGARRRPARGKPGAPVPPRRLVERRRRRGPRLHRAQLPHVLLRRRRQPHALGRRGRPRIGRAQADHPLHRQRDGPRRPRRARLVHLLAGAVGAARDRAPVRRQAAGGDPARHRRGVRDPQDPPPPRRPRRGPEHRAARRLRAPEHPSA